MSDPSSLPRPDLPDESKTTYPVRWRGRQEGPYTLAAIETKLAANQLGLLHEIQSEGQWLTLRDFLSRREAEARALQEVQAQAEAEAAARADAALAERQRAELAREEQRKKQLRQAALARPGAAPSSRAPSMPLQRPHRAGTILALGLIGLLICGPVCVAAWVMGDSDLREMDAGLMDPSGRSTTATGRLLGRVGTIIWIIGFVALLLLKPN